MTAPGGEPPIIGGFAHMRYLGSGGFGEVHQYVREASGASVAIKVLRVDRLTGGGIEDVMREAQALGRPSDRGAHPNIVAVQEVGLTEKSRRPFLVMEYCPGGSWAQHIEKAGLVDPWAVLNVGIQIAGALYTLHQRGIVHRDVKPGNILFGRQAVPKLADLGIATLTRDEVNRGSAWLSRDYAAAEVVVSRVSNELSDLFSLAATLYHALAGRSWVRLPKGDNSPEAIDERIIAGRVPEIAGNDIPDRLKRLIIGAMHPDARTRAGNVGLANPNGDRRVEALKLFAFRLRDIQEEQNYTTLTRVPIDDLDDWTEPAEPAVAPILPPEPNSIWAPPVSDPAEATFDSDLIGGWDLPKGDTEHAGPIGRSAVRQRDPEATRTEETSLVVQIRNRRPRNKKVWLAIAGAAAVVAAVVGINVLVKPVDGSPGGGQSQRPQGEDAIPDRMALPVPVVTGKRDSEGTVTFQWTYANQETGDKFNVQRSGQEKSELADRPQWTLAGAAPGVEVCLRVSLIRQNLVGSPSVQVCA
ncbi:hypothetical protein Rhe02_75060 [Rhizocola hellebori]|uniref:Protein kinase domain-containing protein n=1 Tax=Rhizocola hellebori TaxID=1392758 RepID=A0A8J3QGY2_9ACTN|nr:serine/threonine-protein kinase [Rhizocola hellebori]GIH09439.1 hypothetical protein Rhe02_75060 [Rhizocola hellebori]